MENVAKDNLCNLFLEGPFRRITSSKVQFGVKCYRAEINQDSTGR
jgi:hypothetical protein